MAGERARRPKSAIGARLREAVSDILAIARRDLIRTARMPEQLVFAVLMGIFFVIPLYLQLVLGLNALETGIRMLPVSVAMFVASAAGDADYADWYVWSDEPPNADAK